LKESQEIDMTNYIPARIYLYDYSRLIINVAVTVALAVIVYSVIFGIVW
jgi:hypothetical protein